MQPQYPQQPPMPQYPPQAYYPQQPVQPYPQPAPYPPVAYAQPAAAPTVAGSLDEFFAQPSTGSKSWVFKERPIGTTYSGIVARPLGSGDVRQQTDTNGRGLTFKDGRPKFVMVVPMIVQPSPEYPEGQASWWVKGQARDELSRAMAEAGAPEGPPEAGAAISVTFVGMRPIPGMSPAYQYRVSYRRPVDAPFPPPAPWSPGIDLNPYTEPLQPATFRAEGTYGPAPQQAPPVQPGAGAYEGYQPQPTIPTLPQPHPQAPATPPVQPQPAYVAGMEGQPIPALNIGPTVTPPVPPAAPAQPQGQMPAGLTPEQQALLAQLTGG